MTAATGHCRAGLRPARVGLDFDNTIAGYDDLMHEAAVGWGLIEAGESSGKKGIRDRLRTLPDGEAHWRRLQTFAYGEGMARARPMEGVRQFLRFCRTHGIPVWIVSHKTEYNNFGPPTVNLRRAAFDWLEEQGFFEQAVTGLSPERVFFESTREEKIARIAHLAPTHFVDDLEETFLERAFPVEVKKIHYAPHGERSSVADALRAGSWAEIVAHFEALVARGRSGNT